MLEVTKKEIAEFIKEQPDDRPLDMKENKIDNECGCLMIHYARENGIDCSHCGISDWVNRYGDTVATFTNGYFHSFNPSDKCSDLISVYADLKSKAKQYLDKFGK